MVKVIVCLKRKPGMSADEFHRYWKEVHGPLAMNIPEFFGYVRRYVQCHALEVTGPPFFRRNPSAFDGVVELWFDSTDDVAKAFGSAGHREIIAPDGENFLDVPSCRMVVTEELVLHG